MSRPSPRSTVKSPRSKPNGAPTAAELEEKNAELADLQNRLLGSPRRSREHAEYKIQVEDLDDCIKSLHEVHRDEKERILSPRSNRVPSPRNSPRHISSPRHIPSPRNHTPSPRSTPSPRNRRSSQGQRFTSKAEEIAELNKELAEAQQAMLSSPKKSKERALLKARVNELDDAVRIKYLEYLPELDKQRQIREAIVEDRKREINKARQQGSGRRAGTMEIVGTIDLDRPAHSKPPPMPMRSPSGSVTELGGNNTISSHPTGQENPEAVQDESGEEESTEGMYPKATNATMANCWSVPPPTAFPVRGANYFKDKKKYASKETSFELLGCDCFASNKKVASVVDWEGSVFQRTRRNYARRGEKCPPILIINFMNPGTPRLFLVMYYLQKDIKVETEEDEMYKKMVDHFMTTDNDKFRKNRFKLIPNVDEGPWMVKKAVGSPGAPAIIGKKLEMQQNVGEGFCELAVDVGSSTVAERVLGICKGVTKNLVIDLAFTIEGKKAEELPERLIGGVRLRRVDLGSLKTRDIDQAGEGVLTL